MSDFRLYKSHVFMSLMVASLVFFIAGTSGAAEKPAEKPKATEDVCRNIQKAIGEGLDVEAITRSSIEVGHNPCLVVACAVEAGGDIGAITSGAMAAGTSSDVIARCALNAGADPDLIALAVLAAENNAILCYTPPQDRIVPDFDFSDMETFKAPYDPVSPATF